MKRFSMKEILKKNPYALRIAAKDLKQVNFGDVVRLKGEEIYAVCTWTVKRDDPGFTRGVLLVSKESISSYLDMAGKYIDVTVGDKNFALFPWLDAPINVARIQKVVFSMPENKTDEVFKATEWSLEPDYGDLDARFQNALIGWMNKMLVGDLFAHLDDIESR